MMRYAITKNAVILSLFAISTAAALAITNELTIGKVECNKQAALMASLNEVMPHDRHDNDLLADRITVSKSAATATASRNCTEARHRTPRPPFPKVSLCRWPWPSRRTLPRCPKTSPS